MQCRFSLALLLLHLFQLPVDHRLFTTSIFTFLSFFYYFHFLNNFFQKFSGLFQFLCARYFWVSLFFLNPCEFHMPSLIILVAGFHKEPSNHHIFNGYSVQKRRNFIPLRFAITKYTNLNCLLFLAHWWSKPTPSQAYIHGTEWILGQVWRRGLQSIVLRAFVGLVVVAVNYLFMQIVCKLATA